VNPVAAASAAISILRRIAAEAAPVFILAGLATPLAADYQDGLDAYAFGDYATAMAEWQTIASSPPAEVGPVIFAEAHYAIGKLYWQGNGVAQSFRAAYEWLLKAAELGHAGAQARLGSMYTDGLAVRQDFAQALDWFGKAADGGNIDGLYNLGMFYYYGWGVERDLTQAVHYLGAAAELGDAPSAAALQQALAEIDRQKLDAAPKAAAAVDPVQVDWQPDLASDDAWTLFAAASDVDSLASPAPAESADPAEVDANDDSGTPWRDEAWIAAQNPNHYTIQVMALSDFELLLQQVDGFETWAPFAVYTVQKNTNPLHVLVQGSYADVESARAAQKVFPRKIQKQDKLWIRRFEMVQRLLE